MLGLTTSSHSPKVQIKLATTVLFTLLSVVLLASSCEARGLRVHGKGSSRCKSHLPAGKDDVACSKVGGLLTRQADARTKVYTAIDDDSTHPDSKALEGVAATASPEDSVPAKPVVEASHRLLQEDAGFHLDYDGPSTHPPAHN